MKRSTNIKDSIMMPPPKARPKSRSDTSEELRKNLTESITNISDNNSALQEEFHKFFKENDDELSISKSSSSNYFDRLNNIALNSIPNQHLVCICNSNPSSANNNVQPISQCQACLINNNHNNNNNNGMAAKNSFNFNLVNYNYNYTNFSDDEENVESLVSLEKLRRNLIEEKVNESKNNLHNTQHNSGNNSNENLNKINLYKNFSKLPPPKNKKEVRMFVNNMMSYICHHEFDSNLLILKIKIQTRDNDYKNKGLKFDYFSDCLGKMQRELITRICMFHEEDKKVDNGKIYLIKSFLFLTNFMEILMNFF